MGWAGLDYEVECVDAQGSSRVLGKLEVGWYNSVLIESFKEGS